MQLSLLGGFRVSCNLLSVQHRAGARPALVDLKKERDPEGLRDMMQSRIRLKTLLVASFYKSIQWQRGFFHRLLSS